MATSNKATGGKWWTLGAVSLGTFMLLLDVTIVNVALGDIQDDLGAKFADLQWVIDAYTLLLASFLLTWGSLADIYGRRRIYLAGISIFTLASMGCALSLEPLALDIFRAIQGIGAAAMFATGLALLGSEFQGKERGMAFGTWGAAAGAASAIGPLLGGGLTEAFGWESIFYVNVPMGVIAFALMRFKAQDSHVRVGTPRVDTVGLVSFSVGLFAVVYALVRGNDAGWLSPEIMGALVVGAGLSVVFVRNERSNAKPMLDFELFHKPTFVGASVAALVMSASVFAIYLYVTLYLVSVLGYSPWQTGVRFLPTTLFSLVVAGAAGKLMQTVSVRLLMGWGLVLIAIGLAMIAATVSTTSSWVTIMFWLTVAGAGVGLVNTPLASTAVGVVPKAKGGMASGINSTFRQAGTALGIAGLGAVFQWQITHHMLDKLNGTFEPGTVRHIANAITDGDFDAAFKNIPYSAQEIATESIKTGFIQGIDLVAITAAVIAAVGAVVVFKTVRDNDFVVADSDGQ